MWVLDGHLRFFEEGFLKGLRENTGGWAAKGPPWGVFLGDVGSKYHPKEVNLNPPKEA